MGVLPQQFQGAVEVVVRIAGNRRQQQVGAIVDERAVAHAGITKAPQAFVGILIALLGHTLEICRGSKLTANLRASALPVLPQALAWAQAGDGPGAIERNWASYGQDVDVSADVAEWQKRLALDPQTSGGLLLAICVAAALNLSFLGVILLYMVTSLAYSLKLKRMRWVDVATLAGLYTIRVIAGAAAAQVYVSIYMLIFIFPIFITLGCVKRLVGA